MIGNAAMFTKLKQVCGWISTVDFREERVLSSSYNIKYIYNIKSILLYGENWTWNTTMTTSFYLTVNVNQQ